MITNACTEYGRNRGTALNFIAATGITDVKEIYAAAHANTQKIFPGSVRDMEEVFDTFKGSKNPGEIKQARIFMEEGLEADRRDPMYIATNSGMLGGACVILYDGLLKEFAGKLGSCLYIMASSVHEMLIVSAEGTDPDELRAIVEDINREGTPKEEFLSDNIYRYDRAEGRVEIL